MERHELSNREVKVSGIDPIKDDVSAPLKRGKLEKDAVRLEAIGRLAPGDWFRTTLVPLRSDVTRLYLDTWMRETAGVSVGDHVRVTLKPDRSSRELTMPDKLREALDENEQAKAAWERLTPSRQREILSYLNFLKTPAALERNVLKTITELAAKNERLDH